MPSRRTQLKLALACAAAILWLAVGCGEEIDPDYPCGRAALKYAEHVQEVRSKYTPLFQHQSGGRAISASFFKDENGNWSEEYGIVVGVEEKVDQDTLPPENRIPDEVEGVPVFITDGSLGSVNTDHLYDRDPEETYVDAVFLKYWSLLHEKHNYLNAMYVGYEEDPATLERSAAIQLLFIVDKVVDQSTLPPEDRIPECLDGVRVTFEEKIRPAFHEMQ